MNVKLGRGAEFQYSTGRLLLAGGASGPAPLLNPRKTAMLDALLLANSS